jgi:hypothetical protein
MSTSEIAQLRQRIEQEIIAARLAMNGYATVARHEMITHHLSIVGECFEHLSTLVGEQAAITFIGEQMEEHA